MLMPPPTSVSSGLLVDIDLEAGVTKRGGG